MGLDLGSPLNPVINLSPSTAPAGAGASMADRLRSFWASATGGYEGITSMATSAMGRGFEPAEMLFLLQMERKETIDTSLNASMADMQKRIQVQKEFGVIQSNFSSFAVDGSGNVILPDNAVALFQQNGFLTNPDGSICAPKAASEIHKDDVPVLGTVQDPDGHTHYAVPKERVEAFKDALAKFVGALSGGNELQSMGLQRLLNSANEATQLASTLMKQTHESAMGIIRNIA